VDQIRRVHVVDAAQHVVHDCLDVPLRQVEGASEHPVEVGLNVLHY